MSKVLKNLQLTFGETAASPKVLPIASVNTLIKAIEDPEVTTRFSGHITSESGSLNAAQAYSLAIASLTFHGNITPVDFTLKANKTEVVDGSEILFTTTGVPVSAIDFIINNVIINSGSIAKEDIENICSIENNKLIIAPAGVIYDWQATIEVKAITKYTPATEKTINIIVKHKAFNSIVINTPDINFNTPHSIVVPISFTPTDANVPIESVRATLENVSAIYEVGVLSNNITIVCKSVQDLVLNKINIEATDVAGKIIKSSINISNKVIPTPLIIGEDTFIAKNGSGTGLYSFGFTPEQYNVSVEFVSVTSSNSRIAVFNSDINGFRVGIENSTEDVTTTITAKIKVDGIEKIITKTITATYKRVYNEFKVYQNSAWVVPNTNVEVKVGDIVAEYIGEGLWSVDDEIVDESMDVTSNDVVLGKYGKNEYIDESAYVTTTASIYSSSTSTVYQTIIINKNSTDVKCVRASNNSNKYLSIRYINESKSGTDENIFNSAKPIIDNVKNDTIDLSNFNFSDTKVYAFVLGFGFGVSGSSGATFDYKIKEPKAFTPDLSIPISFTAKNGTLNETITPDTPNGGTVVISRVVSDNSIISASVVDGKIMLNGNVEDGTPQTANLTIYYSVNGHSYTTSVEITATYKAVFNEFKVYANSAWVVPNSNKEVKVGNVVAEYIGDGFWMVDDALVDDSMDVTAGGIVVGKYGKNEYNDSTIPTIKKRFNDITNINLFVNKILQDKWYPLFYDTYISAKWRLENYSDNGTYYFGLQLMTSAGATKVKTLTTPIALTSTSDVEIKEHIDKIIQTTNFNDIFLYETINGKPVTSISISIFDNIYDNIENEAGYSKRLNYNVSYFYIKDESKIILTPDLSFSYTSFKAKNGILNELITSTTPNGGNIVLTGVTSSNTTITATIEDGQIKLGGTIADGSPQTSTLTIYYTVNEYSRSVDIEITATYAEVKDDNGHEWVDLDLPSGLLWATCNIGAENPGDYGLYFQWGSITGYKEGSGYNFSSDNYPEKGISADLSLSQDAAHCIMGGGWRIPNKDEVKELIDNCTFTWSYQNGKLGYLITSKINNNSIFIPAAGFYNGTALAFNDSYGFYWESSYVDSNNRYCFNFNNSANSASAIASYDGYFGFTIRAVL